MKNPRRVVDLVSTSSFASVSLLDLAILYASIVALTPRDYLLRNPDASTAEANKVAALSALVPYIGSIVYCLWRPSLTADQ